MSSCHAYLSVSRCLSIMCLCKYMTPTHSAIHGHESDKVVFKSISNRRPIIESEHYEGDSDLESTFDSIDNAFGDFEPMH